jgi:hypothetical protein
LSAVGTFKHRYDIEFYGELFGWKFAPNVAAVYLLVTIPPSPNNTELAVVSKYFCTSDKNPNTKNHNDF